MRHLSLNWDLTMKKTVNKNKIKLRIYNVPDIYYKLSILADRIKHFELLNKASIQLEKFWLNKYQVYLVKSYFLIIIKKICQIIRIENYQQLFAIKWNITIFDFFIRNELYFLRVWIEFKNFEKHSSWFSKVHLNSAFWVNFTRF